MAKCDRCGEEVALPYQCRQCGGTYCSEHRLPESHDCVGLDNWGDPSGVFDSGFDDSVDNRGGQSASTAEKVVDAVGIETGHTGVPGLLRGNVTYVFLGLMWVTFFFQFLVLPAFGISARPPDETWLALFTLTTDHPAYVWTWITSVFAHGGIAHILLNSVVLYFFGPHVERRVGSATFAGLFLASGIIAGLSQVAAVLLLNPNPSTAVLGASGAIAAVLGVLTVLNPKLRIYLYFVIPMPLWVATALFAGFAVLSSTVVGVGAGGVAQVAHLAGLALGLGYGWKLKREGEQAPERLQFGRGPGGGRRRF